MAKIDTVKLTQIGNSLGFILSKEILAKLDAEKGDEFIITKTRNGIEISTYSDNVAEDVEIAKRVMKRHRDVLRKLAE